MFRQTMIAASLAGASLAGPAAAADPAPFDHVSCTGEPNEIHITISKVKDSVGLVTAELFRNDEDGFLNKRGRLFRVRFAAHAPATQFCMTAPDPGQWAVVVYHDQNANLKLDKGAFGIPVEPFGISRNPKIRLAKPKVEEAIFDVPESGVSIEITLKN